MCAAGALVDAERPLVFVLDRERDAAEVVRQALNSPRLSPLSRSAALCQPRTAMLEGRPRHQKGPPAAESPDQSVTAPTLAALPARNTVRRIPSREGSSEIRFAGTVRWPFGFEDGVEHAVAPDTIREHVVGQASLKLEP